MTLADTGGTETTVETLKLGAGSWTVTSDVTAINVGAGDFVRCQLQDNGALFDGGQTVYLADRVSGLVNLGTLQPHVTVTVAVVCEHDQAAGSAGQFYVDPGATLTAVKEGPISAPGITASGTPAVVEGRSRSSVSINDSTATAVTSVHLSTGTWAVTASASAVDFSDFDFAGCYISTSGGTDTDGFASNGVDSSDAIVTGVDVDGNATVPASGATVTLLCESSFADNIYIDAGATLVATRVATPSALDAAAVAQTALPVAGGTAGVVSREQIPPGTWRVRSTVAVGNRFPNNSYGSGQDFLRCGLKANGKAIDGGATELVTMDSNIQQVVDAGSFTSTKAWTLTLSCSHDHANSSGGRWTVLYGVVQGIDKGPIN